MGFYSSCLGILTPLHFTGSLDIFFITMYLRSLSVSQLQFLILDFFYHYYYYYYYCYYFALKMSVMPYRVDVILSQCNSIRGAGVYSVGSASECSSSMVSLNKESFCRKEGEKKKVLFDWR